MHVLNYAARTGMIGLDTIRPRPRPIIRKISCSPRVTPPRMIGITNAAQPASPEAGVIRARLFQHQREGLNFMLHREMHGGDVKGGIIADEPGLGKTLQTIACIASNPGNAPTLIVAPKTLLEMWKNEIKRFYPGVACSIFSKKDFDKINSTDLSRFGHSIIVTSYGTLRNNITVNLTEFHRSVLDEAHAIKNP